MNSLSSLNVCASVCLPVFLSICLSGWLTGLLVLYLSVCLSVLSLTTNDKLSVEPVTVSLSLVQQKWKAMSSWEMSRPYWNIINHNRLTNTIDLCPVRENRLCPFMTIYQSLDGKGGGVVKLIARQTDGSMARQTGRLRYTKIDRNRERQADTWCRYGEQCQLVQLY